MNTTATIIIWTVFLVPALLLLSPVLYGAFEGIRALCRRIAALRTISPDI